MRRTQLWLALPLILACGGSGDGSSSGTETTSGTTTGPASTSGPGTTSDSGSSGSTTGPMTTGPMTTGPTTECGNGVPEEDEECDDGNDVEGDGCNSDCTSNTDTKQWEDTHNGGKDGTDVGYGITADPSGNVIAVGYTFEDVSQADIWIRKYAPDGTETWTMTVMGMAEGGDDRAFGVTTSDSGEIYAVGKIQDATSNDDIWLRKMDADGMEIWTATYDGPDGGDDSGQAVWWSATGIAVAGITNTQSGNDIIVRLYNETGGSVWTDVVDGEAGATDQGHGVAMDSAGNVYAAGSVNVTDQSENAWLRKYDPAGTEIWTEEYADNSGGPDQYFSAAVDKDDNIVVGGSTRKGTAGDNVFIRKYDPDGMLLWTHFYNAPSSGNDRVNGVATDADGNIVAGGYKTVGTSDLDMWLRKFEPGGLPTWTQSLAGDAMQADEIHDVATDADGNVLAIGELRNGSNTADIWVAKFAP